MMKVCNPRTLSDLWNGKEIGDPFLMRFNGSYYLYCSSHGRPGIKCWRSEDMVTFTYQGLCCEDERVLGAYAPEVAYISGKFVMVTSPVGSGHYLLVSDSPLGPFQVVGENYGLAIDGSVYLDDDGRSYFLRAGHQGIVLHDMSAFDQIDPHGRVLANTWLGHWTEGPMIVKREGRYFLTETGNHVLSKGYRVEYRVSDQVDSGYRKLREPVLLLETRDEFHALGHSSSCLGPDMDTMYIVYHKNILDARNRPDHRSLNMDALCFNGDRMYCNASWWPVPAPRRPVCESRAGEGLISTQQSRMLPIPTPSCYSAELNFTRTGPSAAVFFSGSGALRLFQDNRWQATIEGQAYEGLLSSAWRSDALTTVHISLFNGKLILKVCGMEILRLQTGLGGGAIGLDADSEPGYMGFADVAQGSGDSALAKAVPGTWDAVHSLDELDTAEGEPGCRAAVYKASQCYRYPVSVWQTGAYHLFISLRASALPLKLSVNGQAYEAQPSGAADPYQMERRYVGLVSLQAGEGILSLQSETQAAIDRIYLCEATPGVAQDIIREGQNCARDALQIIGHKADLSMLRKFSGFTCAEGYGEAYFGGSWREISLRAVLYVDPCSPDAAASIYLRSRRESWHPHQVSAGRIAYCIRIKPNLIELIKQEYEDEPLASVSLPMTTPCELDLLCEVQNSTVRVTLQGASGPLPLLSYTDSYALLCGRVGLDARGDGIGFQSLSVLSAE